jgi:ketosteroid isomerase-like protein
MSGDNVETVRGAYEEFARGNFWLPELFDPDVRIRWLDAVGAESETVGVQAMSSFVLDWLEMWDDLKLVPERIIDAGDQVVVIGAWRGRGKTSGVATEWRHATIWTLRHGKVISSVGYEDPGDALEAAGVSE